MSERSGLAAVAAGATESNKPSWKQVVEKGRAAKDERAKAPGFFAELKQKAIEAASAAWKKTKETGGKVHDAIEIGKSIVADAPTREAFGQFVATEISDGAKVAERSVAAVGRKIGNEVSNGYHSCANKISTLAGEFNSDVVEPAVDAAKKYGPMLAKGAANGALFAADVLIIAPAVGLYKTGEAGVSLAKSGVEATGRGIKKGAEGARQFASDMQTALINQADRFDRALESRARAIAAAGVTAVGEVRTAPARIAAEARTIKGRAEGGVGGFLARMAERFVTAGSESRRQAEAQKELASRTKTEYRAKAINIRQAINAATV